MNRLAYGIGLAVLMAIQVGCSSVNNNLYVHPELDLASIGRVAIIPFQNSTGDARAGDRVLSIFTSALLSQRLFEVIDPAQTAEYVRRAKLDGSSVGGEDYRKLKEGLGANAVIQGSVDEYTMQTVGSDIFPVVTVTARLVDAKTGAILWCCTTSASGDAKVPILSLGRVKTLPEMAHEVCKHLVETIR